MDNTNWKAWGLVFILTMGILFEFIKHNPGGSQFMDQEGLRIANEIARPFSVKNALSAKKHVLPAHPLHVAAMTSSGETNRKLLEKLVAANSPQQTTIGQDKTAAKIEKKELEECNEENPKIDPATGKPAPCKKKKKKKTAEKTAQASPPPEVTPEVPKDNNLAEIVTAVVAKGKLPATMAIPMVIPPNYNANSLQSWEQRLLNQPNPAQTRLFIQAYQANLVTADTFYKITEMMLNDQRPGMKLLGILCAGTNTNVVSFQLLAKTDAGAAPGSDVKRAADSALSAYATIANLPILQRILSSTQTAQVDSVALTELNAAAQKYLGANAPGNTSGSPSASATQAKNATYFQAFLPILTRMSQSSVAPVNSEAGQALASLQGLLAGITTQVAVTP